MADEDRWRNDEERHASDYRARGRWRSEGSRGEFGRGGHAQERGESFYSGATGQARGYEGYGGGGGDVSRGRFEDQRRGYGYGPERDFGEESLARRNRGQWPGYRGDREREDYRGREDYRRSSGSAAGGDYYSGFYGADQGYRRGEDRGFWDKASDEVASWFGDEDAERRRRSDQQREGSYRGRGPKGYTRSDERIREDVCDRLTDDPYVDASDVEITVSNCEVTLSGTVDRREARRRAEDLAERVSGVRHVQNNLRLKRESTSDASTGGSPQSTTTV